MITGTLYVCSVGTFRLSKVFLVPCYRVLQHAVNTDGRSITISVIEVRGINELGLDLITGTHNRVFQTHGIPGAIVVGDPFYKVGDGHGIVTGGGYTIDTGMGGLGVVHQVLSYDGIDVDKILDRHEGAVEFIDAAVLTAETADIDRLMMIELFAYLRNDPCEVHVTLADDIALPQDDDGIAFSGIGLAEKLLNALGTVIGGAEGGKNTGPAAIRDTERLLLHDFIRAADDKRDLAADGLLVLIKDDKDVLRSQ